MDTKSKITSKTIKTKTDENSIIEKKVTASPQSKMKVKEAEKQKTTSQKKRQKNKEAFKHMVKQIDLTDLTVKIQSEKINLLSTVDPKPAIAQFTQIKPTDGPADFITGCEKFTQQIEEYIMTKDE